MYSVLPYILALMSASRGSNENTTPAKEVNVPVPRIYGISRGNVGMPTIHWLLDDDESEDEPVLGYKIKLWQVGCNKKPKYKIVNGEQVHLKNVMPKLHDYSTLRNLTEFTLEGANTTDLVLQDIEPNVPYHVTVAAYSAVREGPLPVRSDFSKAGDTRVGKFKLPYVVTTSVPTRRRLCNRNRHANS